MTASTVSRSHSTDQTELPRSASEEVFASVTHLVTRADLAGFESPVALSHPFWTRYVQPQGASGDDEAGRLWDLLMLLRFELMRSRDATEIKFSIRVPKEGRTSEPVPLQARWCSGEDRQPVLTILLLDAD